MPKGLLLAAMDFSAAPEDEFHDWYDLEHIPERLRVPGFLNGDRWIGITNPKISVATYDLDNVDVLKSPPYVAVGGENSSPWTKRTARFRRSLMRYEGEQLFPGDRTAPPEAAALLVVAMNVAPEHEGDFNEWYNKEHVRSRRGARHVVRPPLPRHWCRAALRCDLPFCLARSAELGRVAQGGGHILDAALAATLARLYADRLPPVPPRRLIMDIDFYRSAGTIARERPEITRERIYFRLCPPTNDGADGR